MYFTIGVIAMALLAALVIFTVIARYCFSLSWKQLAEFNTTLFAFTTFWGMGINVIKDEHVMIDILYDGVKPARKRWLAIINYLIVLAVVLVFTYQGDGDLACIGTAETIHALNRGENITIIFINNAIYGMTGGQMAPTTLVGMKTATCPYGRDPEIHGYPLNITDLAARLEGTAYVTRQSVHSVAAIRKAKKAIRKAFENSMAGKGSNLVEIVSTCSSGWKLPPVKANQWMEEHMFDFYHVGDLKDKQ